MMTVAQAALTERAREALTHAEQEARAFNHNYIGQEHLLLALARVEDGLACKVLTAFQADPDRIRTTITHMLGRPVIPWRGRLEYTPHLHKALDLARDEAEGFEHGAAGTDHLLLGILREGEGLGAMILKDLGLTLNRARHQTLSLRADGERER